MNTYQRIGIPDNVINTFLVITVVLLLAPYVGGLDFGIFKVPSFPPEIEKSLRWIAPVLFVLFLILFIPIWKTHTVHLEANNVEQQNAVHSKSKYRLQSTPDIILNELHRQNVNTGGIKIVPGVNIHDLKKRIKILNQQLSDEKIDHLVGFARETAFTSKYAAPREDEKLVNIAELGVQGIQEWHTYLCLFLARLGITDIKNIEVLDVGIGNAYASQVFLDNCASLTGVDISPEALNYAKDKLPNAVLKIGSAEDLKEIDSFSKDLYISLRTYQSTLFDIKESLHEAYRVLANGGGIVVSIPNMFLKKNEEGKFIGVLHGLIPPGSTVPSVDFAMHISEKIAEYMNLLGFQGVEVYKVSPFEIFIGATK
ncbi:class I SAM-dependent methyltransferase [Methylomonas sp. 11b]|uniref:class I SAM-dependent methyltransferase n=1 Tax=Methylomonas sp. 11b TaxID=1168169 RepID=UPI0018CC6B97|nr:class I SAM-dependent methyltransferase [Methylomonas sp. 11b]